MPTSSSAAVITDTMQDSLGGKALDAERPRMSETQTDVSSRCSTPSVEIEVALLLILRPLNVREVRALRILFPHVARDIAQRLQLRF